MTTFYVNGKNYSYQEKRKIIEAFIQNGAIEVEFSYDSDFKSAKILRDYVELVSSLLWVENKRKSRLVLITDEMNNNAIEYGSKNGEINTMTIIIKKDKGKKVLIQVETKDTGNGIRPKKAKEMEELKENRLKEWFDHYASIRGRGLFMIILNLVDELYFKDSAEGGLIVWVRKLIKG